MNATKIPITIFVSLHPIYDDYQNVRRAGMPSIEKTVHFYSRNSTTVFYICGSDEMFLCCNQHKIGNLSIFSIGKRLIPRHIKNVPHFISFLVSHAENLIWSVGACFYAFYITISHGFVPFQHHLNTHQAKRNKHATHYQRGIVYAQFGPSFLSSLMLQHLYGLTRVGRLYGCFFLDHFKKYKLLAVVPYWGEILLVLSRPKLLVLTDDGSDALTFAKNLGYPADRIFFKPNGVDLRPCSYRFILNHRLSRSHSLGVRPIQLLACTRLEKWKGIHLLVDALSYFVSNYSDFTPFHLVIVGSGPYERIISEKVQSLSLSSCITMLPMMEQSDLVDYYLTADLYCSFYLPTNVGNPLFESRLHGLPTLTVNTGQTSQYVNHLRDSFVCESHASLHICEGLNYYLSDIDNLVAHQQNAIEHAWHTIPDWNDRLSKELQFINTKIS